jgi:hypothetical protein
VPGRKMTTLRGRVILLEGDIGFLALDMPDIFDCVVRPVAVRNGSRNDFEPTDSLLSSRFDAVATGVKIPC